MKINLPQAHSVQAGWLHSPALLCSPALSVFSWVKPATAVLNIVHRRKCPFSTSFRKCTQVNIMYVYGHDLFLLTLCCKTPTVDWPLLAVPLLYSEFWGLQNVICILDSRNRYPCIARRQLQLICSAMCAVAFSLELLAISYEMVRKWLKNSGLSTDTLLTLHCFRI